MLVKISSAPLSPALAGAVISFSPVSARASIKFTASLGPDQQFSDTSPYAPFNYQFHITSVNAGPPPPPPPATCITPNIPPQAMSPVQTADFGAVGTFAGGEDFAMQFTGCSNLNKIRYKIDSSGVSPNPSQGLLPLISPSTASGLAVQVMSQGSVTPLGTWREINTSASTYSVPMRVRYYKNANSMLPGSVHAAMTISFQYQ